MRRACRSAHDVVGTSSNGSGPLSPRRPAGAGAARPLLMGLAEADSHGAGGPAPVVAPIRNSQPPRTPSADAGYPERQDRSCPDLPARAPSFPSTLLNPVAFAPTSFIRCGQDCTRAIRWARVGQALFA